MQYFGSLLFKAFKLYTIAAIIGEVIISCYIQYKISDLLGGES
jgi:hypothetical protein